ncbi:MAG: hypothetical protein L0H96_16395 [Humibacillus sp.]|nr:hypothetical protein [Humibacillus sp.]MDN5778478.1 hypothetical protein [Humibacillus sp.]
MTRNWDAAAVLAASNEWVWVPEAAPVVHTDEYLVVAYPGWFLQTAAARVFGSERDAADLVDEIGQAALSLGRQQLWWRVSDHTRPGGLEAELVARGAVLTERTDVLALPLEHGWPDFRVPDHVSVRRVLDEQALRDVYVVERDAFGSHEPTTDQIADGLRELAVGRVDDSVGRFVAYLEGAPAGAGGWGVVDGVCRLWGGCTHTSWRGRGAYRAVLEARLTTAAAAGATLGLTHGLVDTSSPILRRLGFERYGEERVFRTDVAGQGRA